MKHPTTGVEMCPWCRKVGVETHTCYDAMAELEQGVDDLRNGMHLVHEENRRLKSLVLECKRLHAYKPNDRLYHAEDKSWWRREGERMVRADPPPGFGV